MKSGGARNCLAVGTPPGSPQRTPHGSKGPKKRRGTVTSSGELRGRLEALGKSREMLQDGGGLPPGRREGRDFVAAERGVERG